MSDFLVCPKNVLDVEPRSKPFLFAVRRHSNEMIYRLGVPSRNICVLTSSGRSSSRIVRCIILPSPEGKLPLLLTRIPLTPFSIQYTAVKTYNYHPPMPLADSESPEQTLGDCAICMDAILVDPLRRRSKSLDEKGDRDSGESNDLSSTWKRKGKGVGASGGLLNVMQMGVGNASARKNYSLAPCHHLFVKSSFCSVYFLILTDPWVF